MKAYYLTAMGIDRWTLRSTGQSQSESHSHSVACYVFQLFKNGRLSGLLFARASQKTKKIDEIILNIIRALKFDASGCWYSNMPDVSALIEPVEKLVGSVEQSELAGKGEQSESAGRGKQIEQLELAEQAERPESLEQGEPAGKCRFIIMMGEFPQAEFGEMPFIKAVKIAETIKDTKTIKAIKAIETNESIQTTKDSNAIKIINTPSPALLLSEPQLKRKAWNDLQCVLSF